MPHFMLVCIYSRHGFRYMFTDSDLSIHVCLLVRATWLHFTYSLGLLYDNPEPACLEFRAWIVVESSVEITATQRKCGGSAVDRPISFLPTPFDRLSKSSFTVREHLSAFVLCNSLVNHTLTPIR